jgi:hypothetical protein
MTGRFLLALFASLMCTVGAPAQQPGELGYEDVSEMPAGIEGERIQLLLDAVNAGDVELATRFYDEHLSQGLKAELPLEAYLESFRGVARQTGGADFHSVRVYDPPRDDQTVAIFMDRRARNPKAS